MKISKLYNNLFLLLMLPLFCLFSSSFLFQGAEASSTVHTKTTYQTDKDTTQDYLNIFESFSHSTLNSGRIWSDKSVFSGTTKKKAIEIDGHVIEYEEDFLEVLSVLGSTHEIRYTDTHPYDYVLLLDLSASMSYPNKENSRIRKAVEAINFMAEKLLENDPRNRIGIVCFATYPKVLAELDHYTDFLLETTVKFSGPGAGSITINFSAQSSQGEPVRRELKNNKSGVAYLTNIRDALTVGFDQFRQTPSANSPFLVLLSNGGSTIMNTQPLFEETLNTEENLIVSPKHPVIEDLSVLTTLMNGAYQKAKTELNLNRPVSVVALGFDVEENEKKDLKRYLEPWTYFEENPSDQALLWWEEWKTTDQALTIKLREDASSPVSESYDEILPESLSIPAFRTDESLLKSDMIENFNYIDRYYDTSYENIEVLLSGLVEEKTQEAFHPVRPADKVIQNDTGFLNFYCPVGSGMKIAQFKGMLLYDNFYIPESEIVNTTSSSNTFSVIFKDNQELLTNPVYADNAAFSLEQFKILISSDSEGTQILNISFPEKALPLLKASLVLSQFPDSEGQRKIEEYTLNEEDNYALPLRFFFTLNRSTENKEETETTNSYTSNNYTARTDENIQTIGDTVLSFFPSEENPYYHWNSDDLLDPSSEEALDSTGSSFQELTDDLELPRIYYLWRSHYDQFLGLTRTLIPVKALDNSAINLEAGSNQKIPILNIQDTVAKEDNLSNTAELLTAVDFGKEDKQINYYLGNNGRINEIFTPVREEVKLSLEKYHSVGQNDPVQDLLEVGSGEVITYYLILKNIGNIKTEEIKVWDKIPEGLAYVPGSTSANGTVQNKTLSWSIPQLYPGEAVTLSFKVSTPQKDTTMSWENTALFQEERQLDPEMSNKVVSIMKPSKLTVDKLQSVNGDTLARSLKIIRTGDVLTYCLIVRNTGSGGAADVTVSDTVPYGLVPIKESITNSGIITDNKINWNIAHIAAGECVYLSFSTRIPDNGILKYENRASIQNNTMKKPRFSNTVYALKEEIEAQPMTLSTLSIDKKQSVNNGIFSREVQSVQSGDRVTYLITLSNEEKNSLRDIQLFDNLPEGLELDYLSISAGGILTNKTIVWKINQLNPGEKRDFTFSMQVKNNQNYSYYKNSAVYTHSKQSIPVESNEVALRHTIPLVNLFKAQSVNSGLVTPDPVEVKPGDQITYYITLENPSDRVALESLKIIDPVDPNLIVYSSKISGNGIYEDGQIIWNIPVLMPQEVQVLYFTASIPSDSHHSEWTNKAFASLVERPEIESNFVMAYQGDLEALSLEAPRPRTHSIQNNNENSDSVTSVLEAPPSGLANYILLWIGIFMTTIILLAVEYLKTVFIKRK